MVTLTVKVCQSDDGEVDITRQVVSNDGTESESFLSTHIVSVVDALLDASDSLLADFEPTEEYDGESAETFFRRN